MKLCVLAAAVAAFLTDPAVAVQPSKNADIVIVHRFTAIGCAGICLDQTVSIWFAGYVRWQLGDPFSWQKFPSEDFLVSREAAAAFAKELEAAKPKSDLTDSSGCDADFHVKNAWDWDIQWNSPIPARRLLTCDKARFVQQVWWKATTALGMPRGVLGSYGPGVQRVALVALSSQSSVYPSRKKIEASARACGLLSASLEFGHDEIGDFADLIRYPTSPPNREALKCMMQWAIANGARFGMFLEPNKRSVGMGTDTDIARLADGAHQCGLRSYKDPLDRETALLSIRRYQSPAKLNCLERWIAANPLTSIGYEPLK